MDKTQIKIILREQIRILPGQPVVVGVSGGADSLSLLDILVSLEYPVIAVHFNHHLRPESGQDEAMARAAAARLGVPFESGGADVSAWARAEKRSLEEAARILRYRFLFEQARLKNAQAVAVGHTADDQVETVLMHMLQGSGLPGLSGMAVTSLSPWDDHIPLIRPLLGVWRSQTHAHCHERGLAFATDASNQDVAYTRNRVRMELIPVLERYNPAVRQAIWRMAQVLAGEEEIVVDAVQAAWEACLAAEQPGCVVLKLACVRELSLALRRAVVRRAAARLLPEGADLREIGFEDVQRVMEFLATPSRSGQIHLAQGIRLVIEPGSTGQSFLLALGPGETGAALALHSWPQIAPGDGSVLRVPGTLNLGAGWELRAEWVERSAWEHAAPSHSAWEAWLDGQTAGDLLARSARPGDRFKPLGMQGHSVKISDFFINEKLPRRARAAWPLVCCGEEVVWVPGFRLAHPFRVSEQTTRVIHLVAKRNGF